MRRPRDSNLSKFHRAIWSITDHGKKFESLADAQRYANKIVKSKWWGDRSTIREISVSTTNNGTFVYYPTTDGQAAVIRLPSDYLTELNMLRTISHLLQPQNTARHSLEFCQIFLTAIGRWMGTEKKKEVRNAFKAQNIKLSTWSPEAKEQARIRHAARRAVKLSQQLKANDDLPVVQARRANRP